MDQAQLELDTALDTARTALARYNEEPTRANFLTYRDASALAMGWFRQVRLGNGGGDGSTEDELEALLAG